MTRKKPAPAPWIAGADALKFGAGIVVALGILWGAMLGLRERIIAPVRAEAREVARVDSLRYVGLMQTNQATSETLAELVILVATSDEGIRKRTLRRIQAKYEIGVIR